MTKGQVAMIAAVALSFATKESTGGRPNEGKARAADAAGVSPARFAFALAVRAYAPHLSEQVIRGELNLDAAYRDAQAKNRAVEMRDNAIAVVRREAPDIAARVT